MLAKFGSVICIFNTFFLVFFRLVVKQAKTPERQKPKPSQDRLALDYRFVLINILYIYLRGAIIIIIISKFDIRGWYTRLNIGFLNINMMLILSKMAGVLQVYQPSSFSNICYIL